ncbi:MAG: hypothetical protein AB7O96_15315 [Pseudobdellovibrionaceae bacterium]
MKTLLMTLSLVILAACAKGHKEESYTYKYETKDCTTGKKSFSSKASYCDSLKNDAANGQCARDIRYTTFQSECPGSWN